jgi:hypothetical protein
MDLGGRLCRSIGKRVTYAGARRLGRWAGALHSSTILQAYRQIPVSGGATSRMGWGVLRHFAGELEAFRQIFLWRR